MNRSADDRTHLEYLVLADSVEHPGGRVKVTGGGWDTLLVSDISLPVTLPFACGVQVPWVEAEADHTLRLSIAGANGHPIGPLHEERFRVGRSRLAGPQDPAHQPFTIRWEVVFPAYGQYLLTAMVDGRAEDARRVAFSLSPPPDQGPAVSEEEEHMVDEELASQL